MEDQKSKKIAELEFELHCLESYRTFPTELKEENRRKIDFTNGIVLGLAFGILGNFFVQFLYPVIESIILWNFETPFFENTIICVISVGIIVYITLRFQKQIIRTMAYSIYLTKDEAEVDRKIKTLKAQIEFLRKKQR